MATTEPPPSDNGAAAAEPVLTEPTVEGVETTADAPPDAVGNTTEPVDEKEKELAEIKAKWPGWPGYSVFRIVVPVLKVGGIIGRKGDLIKKLVEDTGAKIRVLEGPKTSPDRIVLVSGKEEPEAAVSPAMNAILRIFRRVMGLPEDGGMEKATSAVLTAFCSVRLLVASTQAISLIGKQGSLIKSIQETTSASVRVLSHDELPIYASTEERIVEIQGEALKVHSGLEAVVGHLRKFLVDQSILPLFEKNFNAPQERPVDTWVEKASLHSTPQSSMGIDYPIPGKRESLFIDRENHLDSHLPSSRLSLYGNEHGIGNRGPTAGRAGPFVTQIAQTMQIPLDFAEDIIGVQGANIDYIRRSSGAILTVQESRGLPEEITVEIKGTTAQVQAAQQLIQEFTSGHREPQPGSYGKLESSLRSTYSQLGSSSYTSYSGQPYGGGYGPSGVGGYGGNFRL